MRAFSRIVTAALLAPCLLWPAATCAAPSSRAALEFFRDDWTIKGHESSYVEACDWLPGEAFLVCHAEDRSEPTRSVSMSVFGYSEVDGQYTYEGFSGSGTQRSLRGGLDDRVWRFHGQTARGPDWRRWQVTITPTPQGFHFREEVSDRSGLWRVATELEYLRVKRQRAP
jgi:hypothetical protein